MLLKKAKLKQENDAVKTVSSGNVSEGDLHFAHAQMCWLKVEVEQHLKNLT